LALEQAGRLLQSAAILSDRGDRSTAFVLAMFGREELGRSRLLRDLAERARDGEQITPSRVRQICEDHVSKQQKSQLSSMLAANRGTSVGDALQTMLTSPIDSRETKQAREIVEVASEATGRRAPSDRHDQRMRALYVDLDSSGRWRRPQDLDERVLEREVFYAISDYAGERDRLRDEVLEDDFPAMAKARTAKCPGLVLPMPTWPQSLAV